MSDQNKNARPSSSQADQKNAGGVDDVDIDVDDMDEGQQRIDGEDRVEDEDTRHAGGGRQSQSENPDSRWGSQRHK